jgi:hypothetical protein
MRHMKSIASLLLIIALGVGLLSCSGGSGSGGSGTSGSGTVVYLADQNTVGVSELYLASSGTKLNHQLVSGGTVKSFALTPDASAVIYIADQDQLGIFELYLVSLATPGVSTKLNPAYGAGTGKEVIEFAVTLDNSAVVYLADQDTNDVFELYRTVLAGGVNSKLNPAYAPSSVQDVDAFVILPNSSGVIYRADQDIDGINEIYRVLFGIPGSIRLNSQLLLPGQKVGAFAATPDSANVVYIANTPFVSNNQLFIAPAVGVVLPGGSLPLNSPLVTNGNVTSFAVTPDGLSVVYRANQDNVNVFELYRTVIALGTTSNKKLNNPPLGFAPGKNVMTFGVIPDSSGVVYIADQATPNVFELFQTRFQGLVNSPLNPPFTTPKNVLDFVLFPNSTGVVYRANQDNNVVNEIYQVMFGIPGSTIRLNPALATSGQNVSTYAVAPDSNSTIYLANQDNVATVELYRVMFSSPGSSTKLNSPPLVPGKNVTNFTVR